MHHLDAPVRRVISVLPEMYEDIWTGAKGFYKLEARGDTVVLADLRMGQEPHYTFAFAIARLHSAPVPLQPVVQVGSRPPLGPALSWLWRRALGEPLPPPR